MFINYQTEQIGQEDSGGYSAYAGKPAEGYVKFVEVSATLVSKTVTVNGVVFTAVASGATGDQFNVAVGDETQTASNLQQAINNSVSGGVSNLTAAADAYGDGLLRIYTNTVGDSGSSYTLATNYNTEVKLFGANL